MGPRTKTRARPRCYASCDARCFLTLPDGHVTGPDLNLVLLHLLTLGAF